MNSRYCMGLHSLRIRVCAIFHFGLTNPLTTSKTLPTISNLTYPVTHPAVSPFSFLLLLPRGMPKTISIYTKKIDHPHLYASINYHHNLPLDDRNMKYPHTILFWWLKHKIPPTKPRSLKTCGHDNFAISSPRALPTCIRVTSQQTPMTQPEKDQEPSNRGTISSALLVCSSLSDICRPPCSRPTQLLLPITSTTPVLSRPALGRSAHSFSKPRNHSDSAQWNYPNSLPPHLSPVNYLFILPLPKVWSFADDALLLSFSPFKFPSQPLPFATWIHTTSRAADLSSELHCHTPEN